MGPVGAEGRSDELAATAVGPAYRERGHLVWIPLVVAGVVAVALAVLLQVQILRTNAEFLVRPVSLGRGSELVAVRLPSRVIQPRKALHVLLFIRGMVPSAVRLAAVPASFNTPTQPAPDLRERSISIRGLRTLSEWVTPPAYTRKAGGTYALRVLGNSETFGVFDISARP